LSEKEKKQIEELTDDELEAAAGGVMVDRFHLCGRFDRAAGKKGRVAISACLCCKYSEELSYEERFIMYDKTGETPVYCYCTHPSNNG